MRTSDDFLSVCRELLQSLAGLALIICVAGCSTQMADVVEQSGSTSTGLGADHFTQPQPKAGISSLLYVTDRAPITKADGALSYGSERAMFLSFGSVSIQRKSVPSAWRVGSVSEIGRFPTAPYVLEATANGLRRTPMAIKAHEQAAAALRAEISSRLGQARRKEVVVFIHGYSSRFENAALATDEICRSLRNEFVCVILTWPAGGSGGSFFGYNIDRESSEFAVADFKKAIRIIAGTEGLERLHLLAHSRGTDVLATVIQQLAIEAYVSRSSLWKRYKIANAVFFAPDIDLDVASSKLFAWVSDPDLAFGPTPSPSVLPAQGAMHLTVYSSRSDEALKASTLLFGSALRLGQLAIGHLPRNKNEVVSKWTGSHMGGLVDFIEFSGHGDLIGHSYFLSNQKVRADLVALIRGQVKAGDPRRQLIEIMRPFWQISDVERSTR
ncbi:alpha/beta hydrolase [Rhizobium sp. GR12]|uniref:alpha/beta hydrolase n=1 Tax=Rhizobium sp. GR12 TaxID=3053925 RepID=UPI002FBE89AC